MEQTGTNQCLVFVGSMETHVADRMEDYARQNDMNVVDTVFKDDKAIDKLTYYIEREGIICILVRSIWDISTDRETVKSIMKLASDHNISINVENKGFEPATLVWCKCQYKNVGFISYKRVGKTTCLYDIFNYLLAYIASDPSVCKKVH